MLTVAGGALAAAALLLLLPDVGSATKLAPSKKLNFTAIANGDAWKHKKAELKALALQRKRDKEEAVLKKKSEAEVRHQRALETAEKRKEAVEAHAKELATGLQAEVDKGSKAAQETLGGFGSFIKHGIHDLIPKWPLFKPQARQDTGPGGGEPPLTAMCLSGNLRTFGKPEVFGSVRPFLDKIGGKGMNGTTPDLFLYGTLDSDSPKHQHHFGFAALSVTESTMRTALETVRPAAYELISNPREVTEENVDSYIINRRECFEAEDEKHGFWNDMGYLTRSLNQLVHMQKCMDMIRRHEDLHKRPYEVVILARPDLKYYEPVVAMKNINLRTFPSQGQVLHQWDWLMVLPRNLSMNIINTTYARPLRCNPGEYCCGYIHRSEAMFEFLLGAPMDQGGYTCDCTNQTTPSKLVDVAVLERPQRVE